MIVKPSPFQLTNLQQAIKANYDKNKDFTLLEMFTELIKNSKHHLQKINRSHYIMLSKSLKGLEIVPRVHNRAYNKLKLFLTSCTNI